MSSPEAIRAILAIKDSVEKPHLCGWLQRLTPNQSKRYRIERYIDGALKLMDILGDEASIEDIEDFEGRYD